MTVQTQPATRPRNPRKPAAAPEVDPIVIVVEYESLTTNNLKYRENTPEDNPMFMPTVGTLYVRKTAIAMAYNKLPVGFTLTLTPIFE